MTTAAIYARLSVDDGTRESTERQVADCRAYAERAGLEVAAEFVDRDTSAYRRVARPQWDAMREAIERGEIKAVIAWKLDRLCRRIREFAEFYELLEARGVQLVLVADGIDTSTQGGMVMAHQLALMAQMESANTSVRTKRAKRASAARGELRHGGQRPFGHEHDGSIVPAEAELIRDAAERVLRGESISSVARLWHERGAQTTGRGSAWQAAKLRRLLIQPRLAGARVVDDEWIATGAIEPILDETTLRRLRGVLLDQRRVTNRGGRVHDNLLSGLLYCGVCGARMETHAVRQRRTYQCYSRPERPACGTVAVTAQLADDHIAGMVLHLIDVPEVREALAAPQDAHVAELADRLGEDQAQLERIAVMCYADRSISEREYHAVRARLEARITEAQQVIDRASASRSSVPLGAIRDEWPTLPLDTRRLIARAVIARVECDPAVAPKNVWRPERLRVTLPATLPDQSDDISDLRVA